MHNHRMPTREEIKAARLSLKENQVEFAKRFGVDQATIHRWETKGLPERGPARVAIENFLSNMPAPQPERAAS